MSTPNAKANTSEAEWVSRALAECPGSPVKPTTGGIAGPLFSRQNSRIFRADDPGLPGPAAIKVCLHPGTDMPDSQTARAEYEGLQRVHAAMAGADSSVPRPYFLCEAQGLLAMEWIAGTDMTSLLLSDYSYPAAERLMRLAAEWLLGFHRAGRLAPAPLDAAMQLEQIESELGQSFLLRDEVYSRALGNMRETAQEAGAPVIERSWIHGDFKTDNLIVAGSRTVGLDIHSRMENVVLYDIAPFLNFLDLKLLHPRAWRLWRQRARLGKAFLAAYGFETGTSAMLALDWLRLYFLLSAWDTQARSRRGAAVSHVIHWLYRQATRRVSNDLVRAGAA